MVRSSTTKFNGWKVEAEALAWLNSGHRADPLASAPVTPAFRPQKEPWSPPSVLQPRGPRGRRYVLQVSERPSVRGSPQHWHSGGTPGMPIKDALDVSTTSMPPTSSSSGMSARMLPSNDSWRPSPPSAIEELELPDAHLLENARMRRPFSASLEDVDLHRRTSDDLRLPPRPQAPAVPAVARALLDMLQPATPPRNNGQRSPGRASPQSPSRSASRTSHQSPSPLPHELAAVGWRPFSASPPPGSFVPMGPRKPRLLQRPAGWYADLDAMPEAKGPQCKAWVPSRPKDPYTPYREKKQNNYQAPSVSETRTPKKRPTLLESLQKRANLEPAGAAIPSVIRNPGSMKNKKSTQQVQEEYVLSPKMLKEQTEWNDLEQTSTDKNEEYGDGEAEQALTEDEQDLARTCFARYYYSEGPCTYDEKTTVAALADFGIISYTHSDRTAVRYSQMFFREDALISTDDFFMSIDMARKKMREVNSGAFNHSFREADTSLRGYLDADQAFSLVNALGLSSLRPGRKCDTETQAEIDALLGRQEKTPKYFALEDADLLVQRMREAVVRGRRSRERDIKAAEGLDDELTSEFKGRLIDIYEEFHALDFSKDGFLEANEAIVLITDLGYVKNGIQAQQLEDELEHQQCLFSKEGFSFREFLEMVIAMRYEKRMVSMDDVEFMFERYDRDKSGALEISEICRIVDDMGLAPKTIFEQQSIAQLVETADADGSGELDLQELSVLMQQIHECLHFDRRAIEHALATDEGFKPDEVYDFRNIFANLDGDDSGMLSFSEVMPAVTYMKLERDQLKKAFLSADKDSTGDLDFAEFVVFMRRCEDVWLKIRRDLEEAQAAAEREHKKRAGSETREEIEDEYIPHRSKTSRSKHSLRRAAIKGEESHDAVKQALHL